MTKIFLVLFTLSIFLFFLLYQANQRRLEGQATINPPVKPPPSSLPDCTSVFVNCPCITNSPHNTYVLLQGLGSCASSISGSLTQNNSVSIIDTTNDACTINSSYIPQGYTDFAINGPFIYQITYAQCVKNLSYAGNQSQDGELPIEDFLCETSGFTVNAKTQICK